MNRLYIRYGLLLLTFLSASGSVAQTPPQLTQRNQGVGVVKTALLSYSENFCQFTELSSPYAYFGFAFQINGRLQYFKTSATTCQNIHVSREQRLDQSSRGPMFGEQVTLYGGDMPTRLRRENGDIYDIEPSETSVARSYFLPSALNVYQNPKYLGSNPHPDTLLRECRLLTDVSERDLCLWYQAGLPADKKVCGEISKARQQECQVWVDNILSGRINE